MAEIKTAVTDSVFTITLNRPARLNAVTGAMIHVLASALEMAQSDPSVGAVLLRAEGASFCAGDDLAELGDASNSSEAQAVILESLQAISWNIMTGPKPVVAAIQGWVVGAAFSWLLNCDFVVCASDVRACFPEIRWAVTPTGGATALLPAAIGNAAAREALYFRRKFSAKDLLEAGLIARIVDLGDETRVGEQLAQELAALPPTALARMKSMLLASSGFDLKEVLDREREHALASAVSPEAAARILAFRNK